MFQSDLPVPDRIAEGIERTLAHIAASGSMLTGAERIGVAEAVRRSSVDDDTSSSITTVIARKMATEAHNLNSADVESFDDPSTYVEILGIVAMTVAIDTTSRGVGGPNVVFPEPGPGVPTGETDPAAKQRSALVPTVGSAGPTSALSLLPAEAAAQEELHGSLYLTYEEMGEIAIHKGLPRWQLELVAARTSLINHCFF